MALMTKALALALLDGVDTIVEEEVEATNVIADSGGGGTALGLALSAERVTLAEIL